MLAAIVAPLLIQTYTIEDVGTLAIDPTLPVRARSINNRGHVHGENDLEAPSGFGKTNGFFWDGVVQEKILPLSPALSFAGGMNDLDQCVGYSSAPFSAIHGILWENGNTQDIYVGELDFSHANDINVSGWVAGTNSKFVTGYIASQFRAYLRDPQGSWSDLGTLGGGSSFANALNDFNHVVGTARNAQEITRGFFWTQAGGMVDVGTLGGGTAKPNDVNNFDQVVGSARDATATDRPFLWQQGAIADLGTLGGSSGEAKAINDHGDIVGNSKDTSGVGRATLWSGGAVVDLNSVIPSGTGWDLTGARDINELGEIAGTGYLNGNRRAYKLTPVLSQPRLSGLQPGIAGRTNRLFGLAFQPGAPVFLIFGVTQGVTPFPGCPSAAADIAAPIIFGLETADGDGRVEHTLVLPPAASGLSILLQGVDPTSCSVSELRPQSIH